LNRFEAYLAVFASSLLALFFFRHCRFLSSCSPRLETPSSGGSSPKGSMEFSSTGLQPLVPCRFFLLFRWAVAPVFFPPATGHRFLFVLLGRVSLFQKVYLPLPFPPVSRSPVFLFAWPSLFRGQGQKSVRLPFYCAQFPPPLRELSSSWRPLLYSPFL